MQLWIGTVWEKIKTKEDNLFLHLIMEWAIEALQTIMAATTTTTTIIISECRTE